MKTSDMMPSKYLRKEDFATPTILTIRHLAIEEVARGESKPILYFLERPKGVVLNKTKIKSLESAYGDESDAWTGCKVRLSVDPTVTDLAGRVVGGIRLETSAAKPAPMVPLPTVNIDDDNIPF